MKKIIWGFFCVLFLTGAVLVWGGRLSGEEGRSGEAARALAETGGVVQKTAEPAQGAASAREELTLYATAAALVDADTGRVLYGKNADTPMAMASTTKIMTCILLLEHTQPEEVLTVSSYAAGMPKVKLYLKAGEQYRVEDLLYSLMLESHNDSAVALAEHVGRQFLTGEIKEKSPGEYTAEESKEAVAAFARLMNEKALELGCVDTWFITPNGLDATQEFTLNDGTMVQKEHCTTAAELARIMAYCIGESPAREEFLEITRTPSYSFYANDRSFTCSNHNAFLNMMDGALSGKTGFTNKAGYCYVGSLVRDGRTFVVALLACGWPNNKTYKWSDTRKLMQYGIDNYFYRSFSQEGIAFRESRLSDILVLEGQTPHLGEKAYVQVRIAEEDGTQESGMAEGLLMREDEQVLVEYSVKSLLEAPVEAGTAVGAVEYKVGDTVYKRQEIVTASRVERIDPAWCLEQILSKFLLPRR